MTHSSQAFGWLGGIRVLKLCELRTKVRLGGDLQGFI